MADYDASVRVNTKVDNSDLSKLQKDFEKLDEAWENLSVKAQDYESRLRDLERKGFGFGNKNYDELYIAWKNAVNAEKEYIANLDKMTDKGISDEAARIAKEQEKQARALEKVQAGCSEAEKSSKKFFKTLQKGAEKSNGLFATLGTRLKGIALSLLVFNWITKGFNAMVQAMKEGFQNLARYSDEYNQSMSDLKSSAAQLKNGLAAAFEPVANMLIPYLTRLVEWLNVATDAMGQFLAAMQGKSTYTRAKKQVIDYAKSLDTASKSAKRALASFDQLNVLNKNDGNVSEGEEVIGAEAFETGQVETQIASFAERIKEVLQPFREETANWFDDIDISPLITSLNRLKAACDPFVGYIYDGLLWLLEDILQPLGTWTMEEALPEFIDMLAAGMEALDKILVTLKPTFDYIWNNILVPLGEFTGEVFLWAIDLIKEAFEGLADLFVEHGDGINLILESIGKAFEYVWISQIKPTLQFVMGALKTLLQYIIRIVGDIIDVLAGIIDFIAGVFTGDWERAWGGLVNIFRGIINGIIDIYESLVNGIIDGLNRISIDVPDWVPNYGGETFGFNLARLELPRLAEGAVIPGGRPFAAILGDQRAGQTNIETPLATMVDAFKQALAENGGGTGGSYTFIAQLNGDTLFEETVRQDQMYYNATGKGAYQH